MTYDEWNVLHHAANGWWQTMRVVCDVANAKPSGKDLREWAAERLASARPGEEWWKWQGLVEALKFIDYVLALEHDEHVTQSYQIDTSKERT